MTTGEKIKNIRIRKKMTQSELSGTCVTRNMLSQIENGTATPSLSTLKAIAERLDTPIEYFLSEIDDESVFRRLADDEKLTALFEKGDYETCVGILAGATDHAGVMMLTECFFALGKARLFAGELFSARKYFEECAEAASRSAFAARLGDQARENVNLIDGFCGRRELAAREDIFGYVASSCGDETAGGCHRRAKALMESGDYAAAAELLSGLAEKASSLGALCEYRVASDMEKCLISLERYREAYEYTQKRTEISERFGK